MNDEAYRAGLRDRLTTLALKEGLKPVDQERLCDAMLANGGLSIHFHQMETDETVSDRLVRLSKQNAALFEQPQTPSPVHDAGMPEGFRKFLGSLDWSKLAPTKKAMLWGSWCRQSGHTERMPMASKPAAASHHRPILVDLQREANRLVAEKTHLLNARSGNMREQAANVQRLQVVNSRLAILRDRGVTI
jgi:hypothetical protein